MNLWFLLPRLPMIYIYIQYYTIIYIYLLISRGISWSVSMSSAGQAAHQQKGQSIGRNFANLWDKVSCHCELPFSSSASYELVIVFGDSPSSIGDDWSMSQWQGFKIWTEDIRWHMRAMMRRRCQGSITSEHRSRRSQCPP